MNYHVYIIKSLKDHGYYYGYTTDIEARLIKHNTLMVRSTKSRAPFILHYSESFNTKSEALKREKFFKSINGYNWLKDNKIT